MDHITVPKIALHHIDTVEKLPITSLGCPLILHCKNFRVAHFVLDSDVVCHEVYISLLKLSQPALPEDLYAFSYNPKSSKEMRENGWKMIDPISDFGRMGIPNRYWTITDANKNYEICSTYPPEIVVPKSVTLGTVVGSSKFRSKERVPVLSYLYKENNAAICRCSQPLSGFNTRCIDDELLLEAISQTNPGGQFMYVVDTRPKLNAIANRAAGKGYENEDNYANIRFRFMGIENIHVMRSSLQKLLEVCELKTPTMSEFLSGLESSGWLRHIKAIMDAGIFIAKAVKVEKANVLVHCSDGWDRTAQVCSVASILLDPFYRTFKGLMILIEKEWISMGHKFSQRCGHLDGDAKEVSPIFTQFLDCIWQLMEQFPCAFEFNENFLLEIHDHIFSCQFGNFLGNCQKDREDLRVYEKTHSVWPFLVQRKPDFRNPLYKGFTMYGVLNPSTVPYNIQFWCGMYNRFDRGLQPKQSMLESLLEIKKQRAMLEADVHKLEKIWHIFLLIMRIVLLQLAKMNLMDITKIFSLLQPDKEEEDTDTREKQALSQAVYDNDCYTLDQLLRQERYKCFINSRSGWGVPGTPLRLAASYGHVSCLRVLLAHGADVDSLDIKAQTPLFTAVSHGHLDCVRVLLEAGACPGGSIYNNCSPVLTAARDGAVAILKELLSHGAEANVKAKLPVWASNIASCSGPLYLAAVYGHLDCFRLLLLYGADPDYNCIDQHLLARVPRPRTLLEICLHHNCEPEYIQLLIDFGANVYLPPLSLDLNSQDDKGTALLLQARATPRSLLSQARLVIRRALRQASLPQAINQLDIPPMLISYLKHQL
ncbi:phosphatidylinositol-3,5-bisphosphate 3-phosphatase MTMR8 isoform X2 [Equus przewalskii]|uniref:Phosphatidylinositol-3,5-bisphosphate 3-phosphatase MTMR8 isoform X2 n=1 Tax=Equus przewalskii TaxID=9798 RepID=A0ABM4N9W6_EQUPR|nr:myotubularin-related protein 8 isoform X2 [Equus caballus]